MLNMLQCVKMFELVATMRIGTEGREREIYRFKGQFAKYRLDWLDSFFSLIKVQVAER